MINLRSKRLKNYEPQASRLSVVSLSKYKSLNEYDRLHARGQLSASLDPYSNIEAVNQNVPKTVLATLPKKRKQTARPEGSHSLSESKLFHTQEYKAALLKRVSDIDAIMEKEMMQIDDLKAIQEQADKKTRIEELQ